MLATSELMDESTYKIIPSNEENVVVMLCKVRSLSLAAFPVTAIQETSIYFDGLPNDIQARVNRVYRVVHLTEPPKTWRGWKWIAASRMPLSMLGVQIKQKK